MSEPSDTRSFLFLLGSARAGGNTETLTRQAAAELPSSVSQRWIRLSEVSLPDFEDHRHDEIGHTEPTGDGRLLLDATFAATDVVIASPTYWYSVSASTKRYLDHWSGWLSTPEVNFKARMRGKTLWGVSVLAEEPEQADPLVGMLRRSAGYLSMNWGGVLLGNGSKPGNVLTDTAAIGAAASFFASAEASVAA